MNGIMENKNTEKRFTLPELGLEVVLGKYAGQADGSAWIQQGGTVVLSTVTSAPSKEFPGFFPMTVDYREQFAAAGKIPGGYFKREGKPSEKEVLTSRLIDRAVRPLFPANYFHQLQVSATVYSVDKEHLPYGLSLLATSIALVTSRIPFMGPIGVCEVARVNGELIFNPTIEQSSASDMRIVVAGTEEGINMVEGAIQEIAEDQLIDVLFKAHDFVKKQVAWQHEILKSFSVEKEAIVDQFDFADWRKRARAVLTDEGVTRLFTDDKAARTAARKVLEKQYLTDNAADITAMGISQTFVTYIFDQVLKEVINELTFKLNKRIDGRVFNTVRQITTEVGLLPCNHGSALFTRGKTQALVSVTLGGGQDEPKVDEIISTPREHSFFLHYNFPAFSVGEVRANRGPGRREIGHGSLAESALCSVLPKREEFPYVIRIVADILSSDGSTSMATVCGGMMALMNAGVPTRTMLSGIAMGLLRSNEGEFQVLTDIAGIEDEFGLMDFKVAGTDTGITAVQMDIKYKGGLPRSVFEKALAQARDGRIHILSEMRKVMTKPNSEVSDLVPKVVSFKVSTDKIGAIIGTGGKTIREITEKTSTQIDIADDGTVKIFGQPGEKLDLAVGWVKVLGGLIERGAQYRGQVKRVVEFGVFVELVPGKDGLVHISAIPRPEQEAFMRRVKAGDVMHVEVMDYDPATDRIRLRIIPS